VEEPQPAKGGDAPAPGDGAEAVEESDSVKERAYQMQPEEKEKLDDKRLDGCKVIYLEKLSEKTFIRWAEKSSLVAKEMEELSKEEQGPGFESKFESQAWKWELVGREEPVPFEEYLAKFDEDDQVEHPRTTWRWIANKLGTINAAPTKDERLNFIKNHIELDKYEAEDHWTAQVANFAKEFLDDSKQRKLFYWVEQSGLRYSVLQPPILNEDSYDSDFCYFIKLVDDELITPENIESALKYNVVQFFALFDLLTMMQNDYIADFFMEKEWSQNVKNEYLKSLREFMVHLTSNAWKRKGSTKLYIPL
jgi:hypothetical protein